MNWPGTSPLRPGCCYETAMTRKFYHGRTETMRPCTVEAVKWCTAMTDPSCEVWFSNLSRCRGWRGGRGFDAWWFLFQDNAKRKAMHLAFEKHNSLMAEAQEGRGESGSLLSEPNGENGVRIFAVASSLSPAQALTGTFSACILSPKRRDVRFRNSS